MTKVEAEDVPDHDLLVGGFPCQAFSVAGKRLGFEDTRGTLFFEIARIANVKRPKAMILENVKGLISHDKGATLDTIAQTLSDLGYVIDFEVMNSKYFGVPQNRERIFIVAVREGLIEAEAWNIADKRKDVVANAKRRLTSAGGIKKFNFDWPAQEHVTTRLRDILESNVDEKYYLSEDKTAKLIAQLEAKEIEINTEAEEDVHKLFDIPREIINDNERQRRVYSDEGVSPTVLARTDNAKIVTAGYCDIKGASKQIRQVVHAEGICPTLDTMAGGHREPKIAEPQMVGHVDLKGHDAIKRVYSTEGVSPTLTTMGGGHREPKIAEVQSVGNVNPSGNGMNGQVYDVDAGLSPTLTTNKGEGVKILTRELCCVCNGSGKTTVYDGDDGYPLMRPFDVTCVDCYGSGYEEEVRPVLTPDRLEKRQNGRRFKDNNEEAFTLTAQDRHGVALGEKPRYRIRKLTPRECFRLQGFPDSEFDKLTANGISNSQLYKQAGNAVTVNVISAIGKRLLPIIEEAE